VESPNVNQHLTRTLSPYCLAAVLATHGLAAQSKYPAKMKANFAEMTTQPWFTDGGWTTDFATAKARSKKTGRPIFAYFTRTYSP
jgi:hypothetical protein